MNEETVWTPKTYYDVYREHRGLVSDKWEQYIFLYDLILKEFLARGRPVTLLEIGVQNGGSLEIWQKYLPPDSEIHGVDIDERCCGLPFSGNIHFHLGNAADSAFLDDTFGGIDFDIILDDGSHVCGDVITTFRSLFRKLKPGGVYIIEDMHTSYWENYGGGLFRKDSSIEFFKKFIDALHYDYIEKRYNFLEKMLRKFGFEGKDNDKNVEQFMQVYRQEISGISFFDSILAVNKFVLPKRRPFKPVVTGSTALVGPEVLTPSNQRVNIAAEQKYLERCGVMYKALDEI